MVGVWEVAMPPTIVAMKTPGLLTRKNFSRYDRYDMKE
jgi:hypothetical protein